MFSMPRAVKPFEQNSAGILAFVWIVGLLLGGIASVASVDFLQNSLIEILVGRNTLRLSFFLVLLPFLLSAFAVCVSAPRLLIVICAVKAFIFAFCGFGICLIYQRCSWLVLPLCMFSDIFSAPVLYLYWLRCLYTRTSVPLGANVCFALLLLVICGIDLWLISPFTEYVFSF